VILPETPSLHGQSFNTLFYAPSSNGDNVLRVPSPNAGQLLSPNESL
jgi:hypothetical protein